MARFVSLFGFVAALHVAGAGAAEVQRRLEGPLHGEWYFRTCVIDVNTKPAIFR